MRERERGCREQSQGILQDLFQKFVTPGSKAPVRTNVSRVCLDRAGPEGKRPNWGGVEALNIKETCFVRREVGERFTATSDSEDPHDDESRVNGFGSRDDESAPLPIKSPPRPNPKTS